MHILEWISASLSELANLMVAQAYQLWPYWVSGVFVGALIKPFLRGSRIRDLLSKSGMFAIPAAALLGVASPLCLFGALPILATFSQAGLSIGATWAFLISSPLLNPNLFIMTWGGLGASVALARLLVAVALGIISGTIVQAISRGRPGEWLPLARGYGRALPTADGCSRAEVAASADAVASAGAVAPGVDAGSSEKPVLSLRSVGEDFLDSLAFTGRYLLIGIALAALVEMTVSPMWVMKSLGGPHSGFAVLIATGLGVPLYMCGGGSIPLIRQWMYVDGLSMGGAMAFMIAGPSTKVSNFAALVPALGRKGFALYLAINLVGAIAVGYGVDYVLQIAGS